MNTLPTLQIKKKRCLLQSLVLSLGLHTAVLFYLNTYPMVLQGPRFSLFGQSSPIPTPLENQEEDLFQKNQVLSEVFKEVVLLSPHFQQPYDLVELPKGTSLAPNPEQPHMALPEIVEKALISHMAHTYLSFAKPQITLPEGGDTPSFFQSPVPQLAILSDVAIDTPLLTFSTIWPPSADLEQTALHDQYQENAIASAIEPQLEPSLPLSSIQKDAYAPEMLLPKEKKAVSRLASKGALPYETDEESPSLLLAEAASLPLEHPVFAPPALELDEYNFPPLAQGAEWNDNFDVDIAFLPNPEGEGYIFSLAVTPHAPLTPETLRQNLYFVIDRSSTVQKHRFGVFKRATLKALASMLSTDTFNILLLDKKLTQFSKQSLPATPKNIQAAERVSQPSGVGRTFCLCRYLR